MNKKHDMFDFKTNEKTRGVLADMAEAMNAEKIDEKEFTFPNTEIKLFLIRGGTPRAAELNEIKGAFLGSSIEHGGETFLVFRTITKPTPQQ